MSLETVRTKFIVLCLAIGVLMSHSLSAQIEGSLDFSKCRIAKVYKINSEREKGYILNVSDSSITILNLNIWRRIFKVTEPDTFTINASEIDYIRLVPSLRQTNNSMMLTAPFSATVGSLSSSYFAGLGMGFSQSLSFSIVGGLSTGLVTHVVVIWIIRQILYKRFYMDGKMENLKNYGPTLKKYQLKMEAPSSKN